MEVSDDRGADKRDRTVHVHIVRSPYFGWKGCVVHDIAIVPFYFAVFFHVFFFFMYFHFSCFFSSCFFIFHVFSPRYQNFSGNSGELYVGLHVDLFSWCRASPPENYQDSLKLISPHIF